MLEAEMSLLASFMNLAGPDLIVILLIILVLFGAKKLPELARGMGQAVKEFQKAKDEFNDELHKAGKPDTQIAKPDVKGAESTVARTDNQGAENATSTPQATEAGTAGNKSDQV
jgi:sec-independent protein translocase protein TatA